MRRLIFIGFVVLGALIGLFTAVDDDWATRIVMMLVGALFAFPVGAALTRMGRRGATLKWEKDDIPGMGVTSEDLVANYWRDRGHGPLMKPPEVGSPGTIPGPNRPG